MSDTAIKIERSEFKDKRQQQPPQTMKHKKKRGKRKPFLVEHRWMRTHPNFEANTNIGWAFCRWSYFGRYSTHEIAVEVIKTQSKSMYWCEFRLDYKP